jgi:hypothetical protein
LSVCKTIRFGTKNRDGNSLRYSRASTKPYVHRYQNVKSFGSAGEQFSIPDARPTDLRHGRDIMRQTI